MAGKDYIIPLGVDAANVVNPMNEVIETMVKTESVSRETGKTLQDSFNKAAKPIKEVDDALKPIQKDLSAIIDMGKKAGKELADAFNEKNADPAKLEKALGGFLDKLGTMTAKVDIQIDDDKLAVFEKQLQNTKSELGQLEVALEIAKQALNELDPNSQEFKDLSEVILYTESALGEFGNEIDTTVTKQKTLKGELRGIKAELAAMEIAGEAGSQKFRELSARAGELEDQIGDTNAQIKILASDTAKFDALIEGVNGVVGGFAAAQGAMALFGTENEEVEKALLKVNAAMAILQGLQQVANTLNKDSAFSVIFLRNAKLSNAAATATETVATTTQTGATAAAALAAEALALAEANETAASLAAAAASEAHAIANTEETASALASALAAQTEAAAIRQEAMATVAATTSAEANTVANGAQAASMVGAAGAAQILGLALKAIGIGLIIAAVAYLIEYWDEISDSFKKFLPVGTSVTKWFDTAKAVVMGFGNAVIQYLITPFKVLIDLLQGDVDAAMEDFVNGMNAVKNVTEGYNDSMKRSAAQHALEAKEIRMGQWKNQIEIAEAEGKDVYTTQVKWYENQIALMKKQKKDTADIEQEFTVYMAKKRGDDAKQAAADAKKAADEAERKRKEAQKKAEAESKRQAELARKFAQDAIDVRLETMEDGLEKELQIIRNNAKKQIDDIKRQSASTTAAIKAQNELISAINAAARKLEIDATAKYTKELLELQLDYLNAVQEYAVDSKEKDLELEDLAHIERMQQINDQYKDQTELKNDLLKKEAEYTEANRKKIAMEWEKNSIDDETERQILLIETASQYAGDSARVEEMKQLAILSAQADGARTYLAKLEELGEDESSLVYLRAKKAAQEAQKAFEDASKKSGGKKFDIFEMLGIGDWSDDKKKEVVDKAKDMLNDLNGITDGIIDQYQRQIDKKQEVIDQYNSEIDDLESQLEKEKDLRENGLANNVEQIEKEIEAKKAARDEEIRQQEEMQKKQAAIKKAQMAVDTALQLVNMITATTEIYKAFAGIPFVGIPLAIAAIAAMFGSFAFAKVKAFQSINDGQKFRDGGWINGASHEDGGVKYYAPDGSVKELEGDEFVVRKKSAKKYSKLVEAINNDKISKMSFRELQDMGLPQLTTRDILQMGLLESFGIEFMSPEFILDDIEQSNQTSNKINSYEMTLSGGDEIKSIDKNLKYLADKKRNEVEKWEDDEFYYTRVGTKTTKIRKK